MGFDGRNVERLTPKTDLFVGTNSYSLSGDAKFAVYSFSSFDRPALTKIIRLPDHMEVAALADNQKLWKSVSAIEGPPIEYFTVTVPSGDGGTVVLTLSDSSIILHAKSRCSLFI